MDIQATIVFQKNWEALHSDKRFIINVGGSRSSKTYSICQALILRMMEEKLTVSILRKSFPTLRATVMRDFFEVLNELKLYQKDNHNKTENIYKFDNGSIVEFFSADDEQKLRGRKRDIAWLNEGNELYYDDFFQINLRTTKQIIIDYNPSDSDSYIYEIDEDESIIIKSSFKDNPFLSKNIVKQILQLKQTDPELWAVYGLGERITNKKNIYNNWSFVTDKPNHLTDYIYAIDFGYNHPTAMVKIWYNNEKEIYIEPLIYESYLTTPELIERMKTIGIDENIEIICDYARPEIIQDLKNNGYQAKNANKNVVEGIRTVKQFNIKAFEDKELIKEYNNYQWKKQGDKIIDEPVKMLDDYMDAIRYGIMYIKLQIENSTPMLFF